MAWVRIESSVARHGKFLKAGPAASWLWLCGLAYCQEGLTNGFIPFEALEHLGVKNPRGLRAKLVEVRLWDEVDGGWMVHDYLQWNKDAETIRTIQSTRRQAGANGGKASGASRSGEANGKQVASANPNQPSNPATATATSTETATAEGTATATPLDVSFERFQSRYPESRRKGGILVQQAFIAAANRLGTVAPLFEALENHLNSEQWQNPKLVPGMDKWFSEERWRTRMDPPKPVSATSWNPPHAVKSPEWAR